MQKVGEREDNPKLDVVIAATEKAVLMIKDFEKRLAVLEETNRKLVQENQSLRAQMTTLQNEMSMLGAETGIANFHANAEEDAYNWMMSVKDEDATDMPLGRNELAQKMEAQRKARADRNASQGSARLAFQEDY